MIKISRLGVQQGKEEIIFILLFHFRKIFLLRVALFKLESLVFQVEVGVVLFDLESLGIYIHPLFCSL